MACFAVSAAAAATVAVAKHIVAKKEKKNVTTPDENSKFGSDTKWSTKLNYLELGLWGGSFLLAGEHIIHGEVTLYPPFLTATTTPEGTSEMLHEMGTVGVIMLLSIVLAWAIGIFLFDFIAYKKRTSKKIKEIKE